MYGKISAVTAPIAQALASLHRFNKGGDRPP